MEDSDGHLREVDDGEGRVVLPGPHDVTSQRVMSELSFTVQEGISIQTDVAVVTGVKRSREFTPYGMFQLWFLKKVNVKLWPLKGYNTMRI